LRDGPDVLSLGLHRDPQSLVGRSRGGFLLQACISARDISFSFGLGESAKQILFDVCLEFSPGEGEVVLLTGPSEIGKTTLLTLIASQRKIQRGT